MIIMDKIESYQVGISDFPVVEETRAQNTKSPRFLASVVEISSPIILLKCRMYVTEMELVYGETRGKIIAYTRAHTPIYTVPHDISNRSTNREPTTTPLFKPHLLDASTGRGLKTDATSSHLMLRYCGIDSPKPLCRNPSIVAMATNFPSIS